MQGRKIAPNPTLSILIRSYDPKTKHLSLHRCDRWKDVVRMFDDWEALTALDIVDCADTNDSGAKLLATVNRGWPNLQFLCFVNTDYRRKLIGTHITAVGLKHLLKQDLLKLKEFRSNNSDIGDEGMQYLTMKHLPSLQKLILHNCHITHVGLSQLPATNFSQLKQIWLNRNHRIGNKGANLISKANFPLLEKLYLDQCGVGLEGQKYLSKGYWPLLTVLNVQQYMYFSFDGCQSIAKGNWKLKDLSINDGAVSTYPNDSISILHLFATEWSKDLAFSYKASLQADLRNLIQSRFPETEIFSEKNQ